MPAGKKTKPGLNKVIHERARFLILAQLAGSTDKSLTFNGLKSALELTSGNLSIHLKSLEEAGYIGIKKRFAGSKPLTEIAITDKGVKSLDEYLEEMEKIIRWLKEKKND